MFKNIFFSVLVFALALSIFTPLHSQAEEQLEITLGTASFTSNTAATIYWTTNNVAADCSLDYSINPNLSNGVGTNGRIIQSPTSTNDGKYHYEVSLSGLVANTDYYYKVLCISTSGSESSESIVNTIIFYKPDLFANNISTFQQSYFVGQQIDITGRIGNLGTAAASSFSNLFVISKEGDNNVNNQALHYEKFNSLGAQDGKSMTIWSWTPKEAGSYKITLTADIYGEISESDENNNTYTKTISIVAADKPDLVISDVYFFPETPKAQEAFTGSLRIKVKNQGAATAASAEGIIVRQSVANGAGSERTLVFWPESNKSYSLNSLAAGASDEIIIPINNFIFSYNRLVLRAWVDSNGVGGDWDANANDFQMKNDDLYIDESNEDNNTYRKFINVINDVSKPDSGNIDQTAKHVELFIKDIAADNGTIKVTYGNLGPDIVNGGFAITLAETTGKAIYNNQATLRSEIPKGETIGSGEVTSTAFNVNGQGTYSLVAKIDADNNISEGDENNNTYAKIITVINNQSTADHPDLIINDIFQENNLIKFKYCNQGKSPQLNAMGLADTFYVKVSTWSTAYDGISKGGNYPFSVPESGQCAISDGYPVSYFDFSDSSETKAQIDWRNDIIESNEENNIFKKSLKISSTAVVKSKEVSSDKVDSLMLKLERTISELENKIVELEKRLVTKIDTALSERVKGRILLQVENNGEAWYVDPNSENKFYMKDGQASYDIMRSLGLGITNKDLESIPIGIQENIYTLQDTDGDKIPDNLEVAIGTDPNKADTDGDGYDDKAEILNGYKPTGADKFSYNQKLIDRLKGRIALQVESHGEAWYINPVDGKRYYLGDGNTAYNVMRFLSLGITNDNLRKIQVGEFSQ